MRRDYPKIQAFLIMMVGSYAIIHALVDGLEAARQRRLRQDSQPLRVPPPSKPRLDLGA